MRKNRFSNGIQFFEKDKFFKQLSPKFDNGKICIRKSLAIFCKQTDVNGFDPVEGLIVSNFFRFVYIVKGSVLFVYNNVEYLVSKGDLFVAGAGACWCSLNQSPDFEFSFLSFDENDNLFSNEELPVFLHLTMKERSLVEHFFSFACQFVDSLDDESIALADYLIESMLRRIKAWKIEKEGGQSNYFSRKNIVKDDFIKLVSVANDEFHTVGYYADKLGVSPNYLSVLIKRETGRTVKDWIDERTERSIQRLLLHPKNYTLNDIAHIVGFSSAAQVARFFQRRMGMTCTQYRNKYLLHII